MTIIAKNQLPSHFLTSAADIPAKAGAVVNLSGNLTAFLGFIAAGFTVFFTYRQFQAKVKADSRQAWINSLRARIAEVVSLADAIHNTRAVSLGVDSAYSQLSNARLELELMLNPSEKDHRLLMYLTIKMAFFVANFGPSDFNLIHDVRNIEASITADVHHAESKKLWKDILKFPKNEKDYSNLIDYIMRLSHVVLKREWERVKATR